MIKVIKRYLVVYAKSTGSNLSGISTDVPVCISSGDNLEEMRLMMLEALTYHFEFLADDGETAPEPVATSVDIPPEDWDGVEYFIIEQLDFPVPAEVDSNKLIERRQVQAA